jgi:hypothetical protein
MPPSRGAPEATDTESPQNVHNCVVVVADIDGVLPESEEGASGAASTEHGGALPATWQGGSFLSQEGMPEPFMFGTFVHSPSQGAEGPQVIMGRPQAATEGAAPSQGPEGLTRVSSRAPGVLTRVRNSSISQSLFRMAPSTSTAFASASLRSTSSHHGSSAPSLLTVRTRRVCLVLSTLCLLLCASLFVAGSLRCLRHDQELHSRIQEDDRSRLRQRLQDLAYPMGWSEQDTQR